VVVERAAKNTRVTVYTARPGVIIGKKGADIEKLRKDLSDRAGSDVASTSLRSANPKSTHSWSPKASASSWSAVCLSAGR
jgi:small subunit ribosomal protein S3